MRVLFLGNNYNPISVACLRRLLETGDHAVTVGVYDPKGESILGTVRKILRVRGFVFLLKSGFHLSLCSLRLRLRRLGIPLRGYRSVQELTTCFRVGHFGCQMINSPASVEYIKTIHPDLIVVAAFSPILKSALLGIPPKGCLNLHASLLPKYRGPNPFYWVLKNNEARTGATVHYMDTRIDSGDIILQKEIPITLRDTELTLRDKSVSVGSQLLLEAIRLIDEGTAQRVKQIEEEASYYPIPPRGKSLL